jgi:hypothetical protein
LRLAAVSSANAGILVLVCPVLPPSCELSVAAAKCGALIENSAPHRNPGHATNN